MIFRNSGAMEETVQDIMNYTLRAAPARRTLWIRTFHRVNIARGFETASSGITEVGHQRIENSDEYPDIIPRANIVSNFIELWIKIWPTAAAGRPCIGSRQH